MVIKRDRYLNRLITKKKDGMKIVVVRDHIVRWHDEVGILYIGIEDFLLNYINQME